MGRRDKRSKKSQRGFQQGNTLSPRGKGKKKAKQQKQHEDTSTNRQWSRVDTNEFQSVDLTPDGVYEARTIDGATVDGLSFLRPSASKDSYYEDYLKEQPCTNSDINALLHLDKCAQLWNTAIQSHHSCDGALEWDFERSVKWGLCRRMALKCNKCKYTSTRMKLYNEVGSGKPGQKAAAPNDAVQVALSRHGVGPTGFRDVVLAMSMEPPCLSGLYKASDKVSKLITQENQRDMKQKVGYVKEHNKKMGRPQDQLSVQTDAIYNNRLSSGVGNTPTQPATQAIQLVAENNTDRKYIVHVGVHNKLCRSCKGEHGGPKCTLTMEPDDVIGNEGQYLTEAIQDLNQQGAYVTEVTMDGDSSANKVVQDVRQRGKNIKIKAQRCVRHLGQTVRQSVKNCNFSDTMFPGANNEQRKYIQSRFAIDIIKRCWVEAAKLCHKYRGNLKEIQDRAQRIPHAVIRCYQGDCSRCEADSLVCSREQPWRRPFLSTINVSTSRGRSFIKPSEADYHKLWMCLDKRFCPDMMAKTYKNATSNKCEGCNRAIVKSLPKHLTFSRVCNGRASAAIHSVNNNPGASLLKLCTAVGAPLPSLLVSRLQQVDKRYVRDKQRQKSRKHIDKLAANRMQRFKRYDDKKAESYYRKGLADDDGAIPSTSGEPVRARRLQKGRQARNESLQQSFGSMGWDHLYSAYPR